jgi:malate synthase
MDLEFAEQKIAIKTRTIKFIDKIIPKLVKKKEELLYERQVYKEVIEDFHKSFSSDNALNGLVTTIKAKK